MPRRSARSSRRSSAPGSRPRPPRSLTTVGSQPLVGSADDCSSGIEELGLRVAVGLRARDVVDLDAELFAFERAVAADAELELALGSQARRGRVEGADRRPAARGQGLAADGRDRAAPRAAACAVAASASSLRHAARRRRRPARIRHRHGHERRAAHRRPARPARARPRARRTAAVSASTPSSTPPCSAGSACRSATTSSTAASPHASARCGRSLPADAG